MTITYEVDTALYINITNRCTNDCSFCIRNQPEGLAPDLALWLEREPTVQEIVDDIRQRDMKAYTEIVFCGYGEPTLRLDELLNVCRQLKSEYPLPIRINTNGQANLIHNRDVTPELAGWIDAISISLNAPNRYMYQLLCNSIYGEAAFDALLDFAVKCRKSVPRVVLSVVNLMSEEDIHICRVLAEQAGVDFRVRQLVLHQS